VTLFGFADAFTAKRRKIDCVPQQVEACSSASL
jgi:hypothetical protein